MSVKEDAAYKAWLDEVRGKLPEDARVHLDAIAEHEAGKELFRGGLRQSEFNRRLNELTADKEKIDKFWAEEAPKNRTLVEQNLDLQSKVANYERYLREQGITEVNPNDGAAPPSVAKREDIEKLKEEMENRLLAIDRALPKFLTDVSTVVYRAAKEGFDVTPDQVLDHAIKNKVSPVQAFEALTEDERARRAETAAQKERDKWKEEGRREALSKLPSPDRVRPAGPTIVDQLQDKNFQASDARTRVNDSVKDFLELRDQGGSGIA